MSDRAAAVGPGLLDALSLLGEVADELVVRTVRDTHLAWSRPGVRRRPRPTGGPAALPRVVHRGIAGAVYTRHRRRPAGGLARPRTVAATGRGPRLEASRPGRFLSRAVNGLIGDRLARERPTLAMADVGAPRTAPTWPWTRASLAAAYPAATGRVVVFLHGLCEDETAWDRHADALRDDVRRGAGRRGLEPGHAARQHRARRPGERRRAGRPARRRRSTPGRSR